MRETHPFVCRRGFCVSITKCLPEAKIVWVHSLEATVHHGSDKKKGGGRDSSHLGDPRGQAFPLGTGLG